MLMFQFIKIYFRKLFLKNEFPNQLTKVKFENKSSKSNFESKNLKIMFEIKKLNYSRSNPASHPFYNLFHSPQPRFMFMPVSRRTQAAIKITIRRSDRARCKTFNSSRSVITTTSCKSVSPNLKGLYSLNN